MPWVKLDDKFWGNPQVIKVGNEAAGAFARMLSYCGDNLTDGLVPGETAAFITKPKVLLKLADFGFIKPKGDDWVIPCFLDFNPSREKIEAKREADRERKASS